MRPLRELNSQGGNRTPDTRLFQIFVGSGSLGTAEGLTVRSGLLSSA